MWLLTLVVFGVVLVVTGFTDATIDDSLWQGLGAGWQRWVVFAAGASMVPTFGPMLPLRS